MRAPVSLHHLSSHAWIVLPALLMLAGCGNGGGGATTVSSDTIRTVSAIVTAMPGTGTPEVGGQVSGTGTYADGAPDLVLASQAAGADSRIWLNDGTGTFTDSGRTLAGRSDRNFAVADLDGDGDLDVVNGTAPFHTWINDGQGRFADGGEIRLTATQAFDILFADFNGDGGADLAMAMGRYLSVYHNAIAP